MSVLRVVLDVTVTDAKGKPVADLKQEDFQIFEGNVPQKLRSFELKQTQVPPPIQLPNLPPNTFTDLPHIAETGPPTVILYDLLNTPKDSQPYAREQLLSFLKKQPQNSQVAIFVLTDRLHLLQGFTDDNSLLIQALSAKSAKGFRSNYLQGVGEADESSQSLTRTEGNQNGADAQPDPAFQEIAGMIQHMEAMESSYLLDRRVDITAGALQDIAHFLIGQPGRKNLLWLSGSFPSGILPNSDVGTRDAFEVSRNYAEAVVEATDLLTASHVAVYPVDVRGLQVNPMFSAQSRATYEPGQGKDGKAVRSFADSQASEHTTMQQIAESTGGHAFYNTNGLAAAEAAAVQEGSLYYTMTYSPTNEALDGKVRHVRVESKRPGLTLAYRRTYFADDLEKRTEDAANRFAKSTEDRAPDPTANTLATALQHGAPLIHDLFFEAHVQADGDPVPATPEQIEVLSHFEAFATDAERKKNASTKPLLLQRYVVQFVLLPRQLDIRVGEDELRHDHLQIAALCYDNDGLALNGIRTQLNDAIHNDRWAMMLQQGYHIPLAFMVPADARFLRLGVEDEGNKHTGSLELTLPLTRDPAATGASAAPGLP